MELTTNRVQNEFTAYLVHRFNDQFLEYGASVVNLNLVDFAGGLGLNVQFQRLLLTVPLYERSRAYLLRHPDLTKQEAKRGIIIEELYLKRIWKAHPKDLTKPTVG